MEPTAGHITDGYKPRPQLKISAYVEPEVKTALVIAAQSFWCITRATLMLRSTAQGVPLNCLHRYVLVVATSNRLRHWVTTQR
jgi:hypothetical protein